MINKKTIAAWLIGLTVLGFTSEVKAQWTWPGTGDVYLTTSTDKVGIGTSTPLFKLDVDGDINIPYAYSYMFGGDKMLSSNSSYDFLSLGYRAGASLTSSSNNTFLGHFAGEDNTTGSHNTFIGRGAGVHNTSGRFNVCVGVSAGQDNTVGEFNSYLGAGSAVKVTGGYNSVFGANALHNGGPGEQNAVFGSYAGAGSTPITSGGNYNTFMGSYAGWGNATGSHNVYIGRDAAKNETNQSYNTFVGSDTYGAGDGNVYVGYGSHGSTTLSNSGSFGTNAEVATDYTLVMGNYNDYAINSPTNNLCVVIGNNSKIGSSYSLEVTGDAYLSTGTLWSTSDQRFKKDIKDINNAVDLINKMHPVTYNFKDDVYFENSSSKGDKVKRNFPKESQVGFLAQELEQVMPQMVKTNADGYKAVNYNAFFGLLTQGVKELDVNIKQSATEIDRLKTENAQLTTVVNELKNRLDALEQKGANNNLIIKPTEQAKIIQYAPNPFTENTNIVYFIPQSASNASMVIRATETAKEVLNFNINHKGNGNVIVSANTLKSGNYNCELYVDGVLVDAVKMILVK